MNKEKYIVENYKGNIVEALKKFSTQFKGAKILEAVTTPDGLEITANVASPAIDTEVAAQEAPVVEPEKEKLMPFDLVRILGSKILMFGLEVHMWHLNCSKNSEHLALKELYEACDDIGDRLLEATIGCTGKPVNIIYDNASSEYEKESCLTKIGNFRYRADKLIGKTENGGIDNILGEFCEICNSVIYKLSRLD